MPTMNQSVERTLNFPTAGIDLSLAFGRQKPRQIKGSQAGITQQTVTGQPELGGYNLNANPIPQQWGSSTPVGVNVVGFEPQQNRNRGGSRCGLSRYIPAQASGSNVVQNLNYVIGTPGMQTNASGRVVTLVTVNQGNVYWALAADQSWSSPTNNTTGPAIPPLNFTGIVRSAVLNQVVWFADGVNWVTFSPLGGTLNQMTWPINSLETWVPSTVDLLGNPITSILPVDADGNLPRLIVNWRSRICLSGLLLDPQSIFMSATGDPTNFDYNPQFTSVTQAVALDPTSQSGYVGDVVTCLIPYTDDVLVIGGDHTLYMINGDPMTGGQVDLISDSIGIAFGAPWCKDPYGNIYFVSNRCGIYTLVPGQQPVRISQQIERLLSNIDTGLTTITAIWNDRFQGCHFFFTPTSQATAYAVSDVNVTPGPVLHLFYESRTGAWWQVQFANQNHNPLCCVTFDGNTPGDRVPLIGSWDGYVRAIDPFATDDDGWPINSTVFLGPILTQDADEMRLDEIQGILGEISGDVSYAVYVGRTAEAALASNPVLKGKLSAGRNASNYTRRSGHAIYVGLSSSNPWTMEQVRLKIKGCGMVRQRSPR